MIRFGILSLTGCLFVADAQRLIDLETARRLADSQTRSRMVSSIAECDSICLQTLLKWAVECPREVDAQQLRIGLADVFGKLKVREAIPFLIRNIQIERVPSVNIWLKAPPVIQERLPCVSALIQIGPDAAMALIQAAREPLTTQTLNLMVFTVARIGDPRSRGFLISILGDLNTARDLAEAGLRNIYGPSK